VIESTIHIMSYSLSNLQKRGTEKLEVYIKCVYLERQRDCSTHIIVLPILKKRVSCMAMFLPLLTLV